ncbi:MAG TPA: ATP-dependent helicase [Bacteroidales bacterium]|nr:ATP-dependent helicase [Bacteroidales bacterium]
MQPEENKMKSSLSSTQLEIVNHDDGPILVRAGPGSGKTRVLTERVRRLITEKNGPIKVLCLTFTNKAANEMAERLDDLQNLNDRAYIGTIHKFCYELLQSKGSRVGIDENIHLFERHQDRIQVLYQGILKNNSPSLGFRFQNEREREKYLNEKLERIHEFKSTFIPPEYVKDSRDREIYELYNSELRNSNAIDYDDILFLTYRMFCENPKILDFVRRQYEYLCIDEAQDLNQAQYSIIRLLFDQNHNNIMMVGDPNQAIFNWSGASSKFMDQFLKDFKPTVKNLKENYRCSREVVRLGQKLSGDNISLEVLPIEGESRIIVGIDEDDEARKVADFLQDLLKNGHRDIEKISPENCALIARSRYVFLKIKDVLEKREIKYQFVTANQNEFESDLIKDFDLCLRILSNPRDRLHFSLLCKRWKLDNLETSFEQKIDIFSLKEKIFEKPKIVVLDAIRTISDKLPLFNLEGAIDILTQYSRNIEDDVERLVVISDVSELERKYQYYLKSEEGNSHFLGTFLSQLALDASAKYTKKGISLLTVHSAKGLEFDIVVIMGMVEGIFPDYRAVKSGSVAIDEERREAFVSVTRSKRIIAFSFPQNKMMPWGDEKPQTRSRFLKEMGLI